MIIHYNPLKTMREFIFRISTPGFGYSNTVTAETEEDARQTAVEQFCKKHMKVERINIVRDMFGRELECGDMVCFVENPEADCNEKNLTRVKIKSFVCDQYQNYIVYSDQAPKVNSNRVIKCY